MFTRPAMAGLFFCLASAEGAGLLFCPATIQPHTSVYNGFYHVHAVYTSHAAKQRTGIYSSFSGDCTQSTAHDTRQAQAAIIPPAPHRTLYRPAQPPYYNKVYKGATDRRPCPPSGGNSRRLRIRWQALHPAHLLRGQRLHLHRVSPAACGLTPVSGQGAVGGAEPLAALAASLFGLSPDS